MCETCQRGVCDPSCLMHKGGMGHCTLCETTLRRGDRVFYKDDTLLCADCAADLDADTLMGLQGAGDMAELLCDHLDWHTEVL